MFNGNAVRTFQDIQSHPEYDRHEQVVMHDGRGLKAIIAVHNRNLGPATGGCRIFPYACEADALTDVLRLSRGMTYKSAMAGLPLGGGKSVIIADPATDKSRGMLLGMGEFIESLQGRYVAAEDSGTTVEDIRLMARRTRHVSGFLDKEQHGGDPSPVTARGVFLGIAASVRRHLGTDLDRVRVAVQGVGNAGYHLTRLLKDAGARVIVADADRNRVARVVREFRVACCPVGEILGTNVDVLAPCAMGSILNRNTIDNIRARIVAGAANNQLASDDLGMVLKEKGILYAPDYVINAGGIIDIHYQQQGVRDRALIEAHLQHIPNNLIAIFEESERSGRASNAVADDLARARFQGVAVAAA